MASAKPPAMLAAARLDAYERVARAVAGPARAPVLYLDDEQLGRLFAPRQLEALVARPLRRRGPDCGDLGAPPADPAASP